MTNQPAPDQFGLRLVLTVPVGASLLPANMLKPLFDGVIAAFHQHSGDDLAEISLRLASQLGVEANVISDHLMASQTAVLGQRRLIHPFRTSVQWSPRDEACVAGELILRRVEVGREWLLSGELLEVAAI